VWREVQQEVREEVQGENKMRRRAETAERKEEKRREFLPRSGMELVGSS
jgi:hypothetical protein